MSVELKKDTKISHYRIIEKIGSGGMGVVYKAEDTKLQRTVALKFLPRQFSVNESEKKRFIHEARAAAALDHPHICTVHEINETEEGQLYIVMACYEGEPLKDKIARGPLKIEEAQNIAAQVAEGLARAHQKDIIHRDIKPANVFVTQDGLVKILDFGLAKLRGQTKLTKAGTTLGTIAYMSPEQALGEEVDHRTDIWSLGVMLYEMVTGQLPFKGEYEQAVVYSIMNEPPRPAKELRTDVTESLQALLDKALSKDPDKRFETAAELLQALGRETGSGAKIIRLSRPKRRTLIISAALSLILIILALLGIKLFSPQKSLIHSLAVLPFQNLSGNSQQDFFVNGMHESLLTELSKIKALRVISRTSVYHYQNTKKTIPEIARELNVDWIIEGSAVLVGDTVRINTQLIDADKDHHIWAEKYDRPYRDVLNLHSQLARDISREIKITLAPEDEAGFTEKRSVNPKAHKLYLKGRFFWNKQTLDSIKKSREFFREAIKLDPSYAAAYSGLSMACWDLAFWATSSTRTEARKQARDEARSSARRAIELDPNFSESHFVWGTILLNLDWDWEGAEKAFKQAIKVNPNDALAWNSYSDFLQITGRIKQSMIASQKAVELDPLSAFTQFSLGNAFFFDHEFDHALEQYKKSLELNENAMWPVMMSGYAYWQKGDPKEALRWWARMHERVGNKELAVIFRESHWKVALRKWAELSETSSAPMLTTPASKAMMYGLLGEREESLKWLKKALKEKYWSLVYIYACPYWDFFRDDPRFQALVDKLGIPESKE